MIRHIKNWFGTREAATFTPNWEFLDARRSDLPRDRLPLPPDALDRMIWIAEQLAGDIDFVRVDLYDSDRGVVFGELTATRGAASPRGTGLPSTSGSARGGTRT